jgi:hypothetical protein
MIIALSEMLTMTPVRNRVGRATHRNQILRLPSAQLLPKLDLTLQNKKLDGLLYDFAEFGMLTLFMRWKIPEYDLSSQL